MQKLNGFVVVVLLFFGTTVCAQTKKLIPFKISGDENKWGYKDSFTDKVFIYWHFDEATPFQDNGYARVEYKGWQSYMDTAGKLLFPFVFKRLPERLTDTIYLNDEKSKKIIKVGSDYFEFKNGARRFWYPVTEYYGVNVDVIVYNEKNAKTVKELQESSITQKSTYTIKDNMELTVSYGKITNNLKKWVDADVLHIQCMNFLNNNTKMRGLAAGAGYYNARLTTDSFFYKINMITFGVMQRISFGSNARVSIDIGIHPILSRSGSYTSKLYPNSGSKAINSFYESQTTAIKAITELGITAKVSELFRVGVAMRGIPTGITAGPASRTILLKASFCW